MHGKPVGRINRFITVLIVDVNAAITISAGNAQSVFSYPVQSAFWSHIIISSRSNSIFPDMRSMDLQVSVPSFTESIHLYTCSAFYEFVLLLSNHYHRKFASRIIEHFIIDSSQLLFRRKILINSFCHLG
jgi:hypothetical protein